MNILKFILGVILLMVGFVVWIGSCDSENISNPPLIPFGFAAIGFLIMFVGYSLYKKAKQETKEQVEKEVDNALIHGTKYNVRKTYPIETACCIECGASVYPETIFTVTNDIMTDYRRLETSKQMGISVPLPMNELHYFLIEGFEDVIKKKGIRSFIELTEFSTGGICEKCGAPVYICPKEIFDLGKNNYI